MDMLWLLYAANVAPPANTWVDVAGLIVSALLLTVTAVSAFCAFRAYRHQKERGAKETACQLAAFYAQKILPRYTFVSKVFRDSKLEMLAQTCFDPKDGGTAMKKNV